MKQISVFIFILFFSSQLLVANETSSPLNGGQMSMMSELMGKIEYNNIAAGTLTINGHQYQLAPDVKIYGGMSKVDIKAGMHVGYELSSATTISKIWAPSPVPSKNKR